MTRFLLRSLMVAAAGVTAAVQPPPEIWQFIAGSSAEQLRVVIADRPSGPTTAVSLPHRVLLPNRPLWYERTLDLPANAVLHVDADDGAQVFVNGVQWRNQSRVFYQETSLPAGAHRVTIRVLNNAMSGGLRRVRVTEALARSEAEAASAAAPLPRVPLPDFARLPGADEPCAFTLWADSQSGWETFARVVARMAERPQHFSAGVGDLVNDGADRQEWSQLVRLLQPLLRTTVVVPIVGNHDYDGFYNELRSRWYHETFARETTWSSWSCGPARFVAIDLNTEFPIGIGRGSAQHEWLQRETSSPAWQSAAWRILLVHQPPFSTSWQGYDGDAATRAIVFDLATRGLDLVVSGHSHAYEHLRRRLAGRAIDVLITGGAGGSLEDAATISPGPGDRVIVAHHFVRALAQHDAMSVDAVGVDGAVLDSWRLARRAP